MLIVCEVCGATIFVPKDAAGKRVKCPICVAAGRERADDSPATPATPPDDPWVEPPQPLDLRNAPEGATPSSKPPVPDYDEPGGGYDDEEQRPPLRRRSRRDDDDYDDPFDVRKRPRRRRESAEFANGYAMTSMILGIFSILTGLPGLVPGLCCGCFSFTGLILGATCLMLGLIGKTPGSEGIAWAGIGSSAAAVLIGLIGLALLFFTAFLGGGMHALRGF
jgi:hypothetical protein